MLYWHVANLNKTTILGSQPWSLTDNFNGIRVCRRICKAGFGGGSASKHVEEPVQKIVGERTSMAKPSLELKELQSRVSSEPETFTEPANASQP